MKTLYFEFNNFIKDGFFSVELRFTLRAPMWSSIDIHGRKLHRGGGGNW
jgi:hypothetical protein